MPLLQNTNTNRRNYTKSQIAQWDASSHIRRSLFAFSEEICDVLNEFKAAHEAAAVRVVMLVDRSTRLMPFTSRARQSGRHSVRHSGRQVTIIIFLLDGASLQQAEELRKEMEAAAQREREANELRAQQQLEAAEEEEEEEERDGAGYTSPTMARFIDSPPEVTTRKTVSKGRSKTVCFSVESFAN